MRPIRNRWLLALTISCSCLIAARDLFAVLTLNTSSNAVSIPFLTTDYNSTTGTAQVTTTGAHTLTIKSNTSTWTLSMKAQFATFSFIPTGTDPNPNKPAGDLAVRIPASSATWFPLSTASQVIDTGPQQGPNQVRTLDYRLDSNLATNPPGTYSLSVIYTLTSP